MHALFFSQLHIVHYNSERYHNISTAMTQKDGLAVLGILIEVVHNSLYFIELFNEHLTFQICLSRQVMRQIQGLTI